MVLRQGKVYIQNRFGGWIRETDEGYEFAYDEAYRAGAEARAVSLTLPLSEEIYRDNTLFPFFDGLIPEGWLRRPAACRRRPGRKSSAACAAWKRHSCRLSGIPRWKQSRRRA